jgi:Flp pilus assembly protein TadG
VSTKGSRELRRQQGQSIVEFALTMPILLLVLFSTAGFAYLFYAYVTMQMAVREATSSIVHNPHQTVAAVQTTLRNSMVTLDPSAVEIDVQPSTPSTWVSGVQVSVSGIFSVSIPIRELGTIQFKAQSVMTVE